MTRRTRPRPRRGFSALANLEPFERPQDRLNARTPDVTRCAWPSCREPLQFTMGDKDPVSTRYGILCRIHAADVAIAVIQHETDLNRVKQFFEQQSTERAVRAAEWRAEEERYEAEKAALRQDRDGFVYYLRVGERIKVGYSADVKQRMRAYPPGSRLLAVEPGDRELECSRHQQFAGSLLDGREWFRPDSPLLEHVGRLVAQHGEPRQFAHHYRSNRQPMRAVRQR